MVNFQITSGRQSDPTLANDLDRDCNELSTFMLKNEGLEEVKVPPTNPLRIATHRNSKFSVYPYRQSSIPIFSLLEEENALHEANQKLTMKINRILEDDLPGEEDSDEEELVIDSLPNEILKGKVGKFKSTLDFLAEEDNKRIGDKSNIPPSEDISRPLMEDPDEIVFQIKKQISSGFFGSQINKGTSGGYREGLSTTCQDESIIGMRANREQDTIDPMDEEMEMHTVKEHNDTEFPAIIDQLPAIKISPIAEVEKEREDSQDKGSQSNLDDFEFKSAVDFMSAMDVRSRIDDNSLKPQ